MEQGGCVGTDPEAFFPVVGDRQGIAKRICRRCDVRVECLSWALDTKQDFGIWGGLSEYALRRAHRDRSVRNIWRPIAEIIAEHDALVLGGLEDPEEPSIEDADETDETFYGFGAGDDPADDPKVVYLDERPGFTTPFAVMLGGEPDDIEPAPDDDEGFYGGVA